MVAKIDFKKINTDTVLNILLGSTIITLLFITLMTLSGVLYSGEIFGNLFGYVNTASMIGAALMAGSFILYFSLIQKTKTNYWLLIITSVLIIIFIASNTATSYFYNSQPEGPDYTEISEKYDSLVKSSNNKEEANKELVGWLNTQENVKDAQIKTNNISGENEIFFSIHGWGVNTYDQSYPLDGLEGQGLYKDCVGSCPPEGTDNYEKCLSACESSLGGE